MFGAKGFFGSIEDRRNKPDMFDSQGFFGTIVAPPASTFHILTEDGKVLTTESGDKLTVEQTL